MKQNSKTRQNITLFGLCLAACLSFWIGLSPSAEAQTSDSIDVRITMTTSSSVLQGEPVILRYEVTNNTGNDIDIREGADRREWYTLSVKDESGHIISPIDRKKILLPWEQGPMGMTVQAGKTQNGYIVPAYRFPHPGKYLISVNARLPYGFTGDPIASQHQDIESVFGQTYENDYQFWLSVGPEDDARLQTDAEGLKKTIVSTTNGVQTAALIDALCTMPEAQAAPVWQELADGPKADITIKADLAEQLVSLHTRKSVDILASMLWSPEKTFGEFLPNANLLTRSYLVGDDSLKQHIKDLYSQHGVPFPEHPRVTDISD
jgi:hypothetical protein